MYNSHIRRFILLTRSHAEREGRSCYTPHFVCSKVRSLFSCDEIIVSKEMHSGGGFHFHVGILNQTASRHTATKRLRDSFVDFEGRQLNVSFHKSWNTILKYCFKQDSNPYCWGTTPDKCRQRIGWQGQVPVAGAVRCSDSNKSKRGRLSDQSALDKVLSYESWDEVLKDRKLRGSIVSRISAYKQAFVEYKAAVKVAPLPFVERLNKRVSLLLQEDNNVLPYTKEELGDNVWFILEWLAKNFALERQLHQEQLFVVGKTKVGKTRLFKLLADSEVCNFYAMDDLLEFSDASNYADAFVFDEFSLNTSNVGSLIRVLNKIADGQKVKLNVKYSFFIKTRNLGLVRISNDYPHFPAGSKVSKEAFNAFIGRFAVIDFDKQINWVDARLLLTLKQIVDSLINKNPLLGAAEDTISIIND